MSILPIVKLPDPILRKVSAPVETVDDDLRRLLDDMLETMYDAPGVGLAGIQVGVDKRILVLDTAAREEDGPKPICMVNPEILSLSDTRRVYEEGCLSIPDVQVEIERPAAVHVRYVDRDGKQQELKADGLLATAIQHEIDHLDGKLIIDFLSALKRQIVIRKFRKLQRVT
ncbi:MAG: peptide deformylase [Hyphomicrobiaceae bacterium]|nr:peptide deformylase [Hyphomicrobiaceae bacterium]